MPGHIASPTIAAAAPPGGDLIIREQGNYIVQTSAPDADGTLTGFAALSPGDVIAVGFAIQSQNYNPSAFALTDNGGNSYANIANQLASNNRWVGIASATITTPPTVINFRLGESLGAFETVCSTLMCGPCTMTGAQSTATNPVFNAAPVGGLDLADADAALAVYANFGDSTFQSHAESGWARVDNAGNPWPTRMQAHYRPAGSGALLASRATVNTSTNRTFAGAMVRATP